MNASPLLTGLAALTMGWVGALAQVSTIPVGYVTHELRQGLNLLGLTMHPASLVSGQIDSVNGSALLDSAITLTPQAGRTYILEITSGSLKGTLQEVPAASITSGRINTELVGLVANQGYRLRLAPTLEEIFTTKGLANGGVLQSAPTSAGADLVWVSQGNGSYQKYYLRSVSNQFCRAGTVIAAPNVPLIYADGFIIEKKASTPAKLTITGEVKTQLTNSVLSPGLNTLGAVSPVGLNLANAGLDDDLTPGTSAAAADLVWVQVQQGRSLAYRKYFRHTSGFWRSAAAPDVDLSGTEAARVALSSGFLIEKRGADAAPLDLEVPAALAN